MAGKLIEISMPKQLLRLYEQGQGIKTISRTLGISRNTVKRYLHQIELTGLKLSELLPQSNESLELLFRALLRTR
jgi:transposase